MERDAAERERTNARKFCDCSPSSRDSAPKQAYFLEWRFRVNLDNRIFANDGILREGGRSHLNNAIQSIGQVAEV